MADVFFAHAEEDFSLVKEAAHHLESKGFGCWFYERNTVAGQSYLAQVHEAITDARTVVAVISEPSLKSKHVNREIELAYHKGKAFVPVFRGLSSALVEAKQPAWTVAFGAVVRIDERGHIAEILAPLETAIRSIVRKPRRITGLPSSPPSPPRVRPPLGTTPLWAADGTQVDISMLKALVVRTPIVNQFFASDEKLFIGGTKGLGKTLLLRLKRFLLTEDHSRAGRGFTQSDVLLIPADRPFVDMMTNLPSVSSNCQQFLAGERNCKRLWEFALRFSIISHVRSAASELLRMGREPLLPIFRDWLDSHPVNPSVVFKQLVATPIQPLNRLLDRLEVPLDYLIHTINRGVYVFIDKVDQGVGNLDRKPWWSVQGGLLEAAWDCTRANAHLKIFGTIRDEAFANYETPIKNNLRGAVLSLQYEPADLRHLIDSLAGIYEGASDFSSFVHINTVRNTRAGIVEDSFNYLSRHTVGRPRDLVQLCSALSAAGANISEKRFRTLVNDCAAESVVETLFTEMAPFLDCLKSAEDRIRFFRLLPYNILTRAEVRHLTNVFNGLDADATRTEPFHYDVACDPFVEMWYCGLLGTVDKDLVAEATVQRFKQPYDSFQIETRCLPESNYYLLHPSLQTLIRRRRGEDGYKSFKFVVVGNEYMWHPHDPVIIDLQKELFKIQNSEPDLYDTIWNALPYLHAAWTQNRDVVDYMPEQDWKKLNVIAAQAEKQGRESLCDAMRRAWANWGRDGQTRPQRHEGGAGKVQGKRRSQPKPAATNLVSEGEGEKRLTKSGRRPQKR